MYVSACLKIVIVLYYVCANTMSVLYRQINDSDSEISCEYLLYEGV